MSPIQDVKLREDPVGLDLFRSGMRNLLGGVALISTGEGNQRRGMIVTSACSLSAEPPSLIVCIAKTAESHAVIARTGAFAVNILSTNHLDLAGRFSGKNGCKGVARFEVGKWISGVTGSPVLEDALASFDCTVSNAFDAHSHSIYSGLILDIKTNSAQPPLGYCRGTYVGVEPIQ